MKRRISLGIAIALVVAQQSFGESDKPHCDPWAAQLESTEGSVHWRSASDQPWQQSQRGTYFCFGEEVVVKGGRAALRMSNSTLVRLNANTSLKFVKNEPSFAVKLLQGAAYFLSRTPRPLEVAAPYVNAAVDGTEFLVEQSDTAKESRVGVFEGVVKASSSGIEQNVSAGQALIGDATGTIHNPGEVNISGWVDWGLYYPPIVAGEDVPNDIQMLAAKGDIANALAQVQSHIEKASASQDSLLFGASLALQLGQVQLAEAWLERSLQQMPLHRDAYALQALILLVKGDLVGAKTSLKSWQSDVATVTGLIVQSYIEQAEADLSLALNSAAAAYQLAPNDPLIIARYSELLLINDQAIQAQKIVKQGIQAFPKNAHLYILAGYLSLNEFAAEDASAQFSKAIELSDAQPQAHFGLGLAWIQQGRFAAGREQLELAVLLNPSSSYMRSFLGKAYIEERRLSRAADQFDLAKTLDSNDPSPWFYSAILQQDLNRYPEAAVEMASAMEKNGNRAVYRSQSLLQSDGAVRGNALAQIHRQLGFGLLAETESSMAITAAPSNYAGHRGLAQSLANSVGMSHARQSEALQNTILLPIGGVSLQPGMVAANLQSNNVSPALKPGVREYDELFLQRGWRGYLVGGGSDETAQFEGQLQWTTAQTGLTVGYLREDIFLDSADEEEDPEETFSLVDVLGQWDVIDGLQLQLQYTEAESDYEYSKSENEWNDSLTERQFISGRIRYSGMSGHTLLLDVLEVDTQETNSLQEFSADSGAYVGLDTLYDEDVRKMEFAHLIDFSSWWAKYGFNRIDSDTELNADSVALIEFFPGAPLERFPGEPVQSQSENQISKFYSEVFYHSSAIPLGVLGGFSKVQDENDRLEDSILPQVVLSTEITPNNAVYLGYWEDVFYSVLPSLESSKLGIFSRHEDVPLNSYSRNRAIGSLSSLGDAQLTAILQNRKLSSEYKNGGEFQTESDIAKLELNWLLAKRASLSTGLRWERTQQLEAGQRDRYTYTRKLPLALHYQLGGGWSANLRTTWVNQVRDYDNNEAIFSADFTNVDLLIEWRGRRTPISVFVKLHNALDEETDYINDRTAGFATDGYGEREFFDARTLSAHLRWQF